MIYLEETITVSVYHPRFFEDRDPLPGIGKHLVNMAVDEVTGGVFFHKPSEALKPSVTAVFLIV
jgi:hypothetical protein